MQIIFFCPYVFVTLVILIQTFDDVVRNGRCASHSIHYFCVHFPFVISSTDSLFYSKTNLVLDQTHVMNL